MSSLKIKRIELESKKSKTIKKTKKNSVQYYKSDIRRDVVKHGGDYWAADQDNIGQTPADNAYWTSFDAQFDMVATDILLAQDSTILRGLTMGAEDTTSGSWIRSSGANDLNNGDGFFISSSGDFRFGDVSRASASFKGEDG